MADDAKHGLSLRFEVTIDNHDLGAWAKCSGLTVHFDILKYQEGGNDNFTHNIPGRINYENIKLTRALTPKESSAVATWLSQQQHAPKKGTAKITLFDAWKGEVMSWSFQGVMPAKWSGPTLDAGAASVATEELELVHEGFLQDS
jgi:phage tail-like protein